MSRRPARTESAGCLRALGAAVCLALGAAPTAAAPPEPRPAEGPDRAPRGGRHDGGPGQPGSGREGESRRDRRELEGGGGGEVRTKDELTKDEPQLEVHWQAGGCGIDHHGKLVKALLALENESDLMSLEVWGDTHEYLPYQSVYYYMRVPRAAYVTLFWIGPKHDIFIPFQTLRVPADRDVRVDPDSIVVPPLGREQWVAVATLEPLPIDCWGSDEDHVRWVERLKKLPHGVGRWEVRSKETR